MKKLLKAFVILAPLLILALAVTSGLRNMAASPGGNRTIIFTIIPGSNLSDVAEGLEEAELIKSSRYFRWMGGRKKLGRKIQAGFHRLWGTHGTIALSGSGAEYFSCLR